MNIIKKRALAITAFFLIDIPEFVLFSKHPFYMAYIQQHGFMGAVARLNCIYNWKK